MGAEAVDDRLVQPDQRAQGVADQVQLVLDDQVGRAQAQHRGRLGGGQAGYRRVPGPAPGEVRVLPAVAGAALVDQPEQGGGGRLPRELGQLVHRADDQRRGQPVDLLVDGQHREALPGGPEPGEEAVALGIAAIHEHPAPVAVGLDVGDAEPGTAPRAGDQLQHPARTAAGARRLLDLALGLVEGVGGHLAPHPQPDPERRLPPAVVAAGDCLPAQRLAGAGQRGRPLELLGGEQAQGVAHQHRHPVGAVACVVAGAEHPLKAADGERVGGQAQVALRLAPAGGEEQQLHLTVVGPPAGIGVGRVGQPRQAQQHERQLERSPSSGGLDVLAREQLVETAVRLAEPGPVHLAAHALAAHGQVGESERLPGGRVVAQQVDGPVQPVGDASGLGQGLLAGGLVAADLGVGVEPPGLGLQPAPVAVDQRAQGADEVVPGQLGAAEARHVQDQPRHLVDAARYGQSHVRRREAGGAQPPRPPLAVTNLAVDRTLVAPPVAAGAPVQHGQAQALVVVGRREVTEVGVVVGHEDRRPAIGRPHRQPGLVQPGGVLELGGDGLGVDEGEVDHPTAAPVAHRDPQLDPLVVGHRDHRLVPVVGDREVTGAGDRAAAPHQGRPVLLVWCSSEGPRS